MNLNKNRSMKFQSSLAHAEGVAQILNLPYRRFLTCWPRGPVRHRADWKPAIQQIENLRYWIRGSTVIASLLILTALSVSVGAAESPDAVKPKERELLKVLRSDAPPAEKAITCKKLAVYGSEEAVPALAPMLSDERFSSWARIALEAIPGPAADRALRQAAGNLHGKLLVGVINSIGVRRDAKAVGLLASKLKDPDADAASAAGVALGRIGGWKAAKALARYLPKAPIAVRSAVAEGCIRCAEQFFAQGKPADAVQLYDTVRAAEVPKQRVLEATRGAILARNSAGIPLLLEQLGSADRERFGIGLRTARELPGRDVTDALVAEWHRTSEARQPLLLLALADRRDAAAFPTLLQAARTGSKKTRLVAMGALERSGNLSGLPALLENATDADPDLAQAAMGSLARFPGTDVDAELLKRLPAASGKTRRTLIEVASRRGLEKALPVIVASAEDQDPTVRGAALQAIGALGGNNEAAELVRLLQKTPGSQDRTDIETALVALGGRSGSGSTPVLLPLAQNSDPALRTVGLHALASAGGPAALATVAAATEDTDEAVQNEAVRTLSSWPNTWPEDAAVTEPLLKLARSDTNASHQVLALRGYLEFLRGDKKLKGDDKARKLQDVLPLLQRPEEKRSAIGVIRELPATDGLPLLLKLAEESAVADDACTAIVDTASKDRPGVSREARQNALQTVLDKSSSDATRKKAEDALKKLTNS
jgi:HEAT repeat protein